MLEKEIDRLINELNPSQFHFYQLFDKLIMFEEILNDQQREYYQLFAMKKLYRMLTN